MEWAYAFESRGLRHVISPVIQLSEVESNHRRRRIRSLCFRYNTGQSGRRESNPRSRAPKAREAPFLFLPIFYFSVAVTRVGFEPNLVSLKG